MGGQKYAVNQTTLDAAIRAANPNKTLSTTGAPSVDVFQKGGPIPEFKFPDGRVKPPAEQFQFRTPSGAGVMKFTEKSAFGNVGDSPGLVVYSDELDKLQVPGSSTTPGGVNYYAGGRELELGKASGSNAQAVRPVTGVGNDGAKLYLADDLNAPTYGQRVKANFQASADLIRGQRGQGVVRQAEPEDIARARFDKDMADLAPEESRYVELAQQSDDALKQLDAQGDNTAKEILQARADITEAANLGEDAGRSAYTASRGRSVAREGPVKEATLDTPESVRQERPEDRQDFTESESGLFVPENQGMRGEGGRLDEGDDIFGVRDPAAPGRVTDPPAGEPRVTDPPAGEPRVTDPPAGEPRVTDPPAGEPRVTDPPAGEPRVTDPPAGEPRVTDPPADEPRITPPPPPERIGDPPPPPPERTPPPPPPERTPPPPPPERTPPPPPPERTPPPPPPERTPPPPPPERIGDPPPPPPERTPPPPPPERIGDPPPPPPERTPPPPRDDPRVTDPDDAIRIPGETVRRDEPEREPDDPTTFPRRIKPPGSRQIDDDPTPTPRPEGHYPRQIAHRESVEYSFDPESGEYNAQVVESTDPVVVNWDQSAPSRDERLVGSWDVTPGADGVDATKSEQGKEIPFPAHLKAKLRKEAEREGRAVSNTKKVVYTHDLDSRETSTRVNPSSAGAPGRGSARVYESGAARVSESANGAPAGELNPHFQKIMEQQTKAQQERKTGQKRHASRRSEDKQQSYKLPEIVVIQNGGGVKRVG